MENHTAFALNQCIYLSRFSLVELLKKQEEIKAAI